MKKLGRPDQSQGHQHDLVKGQCGEAAHAVEAQGHSADACPGPRRRYALSEGRGFHGGSGKAQGHCHLHRQQQGGRGQDDLDGGIC